MPRRSGPRSSSRRGRGRGGDARRGAPRGSRGADAGGRPSGDGAPGKKKRRRRKKGPRPEVAPLVEARHLDLDRAPDAPLSDREREEAEAHLAFFRRFKGALRLSLNAKEDLLVNGARPPEDRGTLKHLFSKLDRAAVDKALTREPLASTPSARSAFLAGVVRLNPDAATLLAYLEEVAQGEDRRAAARAFGATVKRIDFATLSAAQLARLLEVARRAFSDGEDANPALTQALLGLLDSDSFRAAYATHADAIAADLRALLHPLAAAHAAVHGALPDDEAERAAVAAGVQRWLSLPGEVLTSFDEPARLSLARFAVHAADGTAPDALPRALIASIPPTSPGALALGLAWADKLMRAGQLDPAERTLRQLAEAHPDRRDVARRLAGLAGEPHGEVRLGDRAHGAWRAAFWPRRQMFGWARVGDEAVEAEAKVRAEVLSPAIAPYLGSGRAAGGQTWLMVAAAGAPLGSGRRALSEALQVARDATLALRDLAAWGLTIPDAAEARFWVPKGRGATPVLVDLAGVERSDPVRAAMDLSGPALSLARAILAGSEPGALRADLPEELERRLGGRVPLTVLARALVEAAAR